jgi:hypothetical protein
MLKNKKVIIITAGILILLIMVFVLSQTVLFTWSPLRIGYNRFHFDKYDVCTDEATLEAAYGNLDEIIVQNEREHGLHYTQRLEIVLCDLEKFRFYIPWLNSNSAAGVWPRTVYVSKYHVDKFKNPVMAIKHELSHILLLQNYGELACATIWKHNEWLPEGLAVYVTEGYPGYLSKQEVLSRMKSKGIDYRANSNDILSGISIRNVAIPTRYPIYYCYVSYLMERYGRETFFSFLYDTFDRPHNIMDAFSLHFNVTFEKSLTEFYDYLSN